MDPIGELDQDHPDVVHHRQEHLPEVLRLAFLARREADGADLGDPLDDVRDFGSEELAYPLNGGERVLDHIME